MGRPRNPERIVPSRYFVLVFPHRQARERYESCELAELKRTRRLDRLQVPGAPGERIVLEGLKPHERSLIMDSIGVWNRICATVPAMVPFGGARFHPAESAAEAGLSPVARPSAAGTGEEIGLAYMDHCIRLCSDGEMGTDERRSIIEFEHPEKWDILLDIVLHEEAAIGRRLLSVIGMTLDDLRARALQLQG